MYMYFKQYNKYYCCCCSLLLLVAMLLVAMLLLLPLLLLVLLLFVTTVVLTIVVLFELFEKGEKLNVQKDLGEDETPVGRQNDVVIGGN